MSRAPPAPSELSIPRPLLPMRDEQIPPTYTLNEAAARCGYRRVNTLREKHLATAADREILGHAYDDAGRVALDRVAVDALANRLAAERLARGNWRVRNLGKWARRRSEGTE